MATAQVRSAQLAIESTPGSVDANGLVDISGLTFRSIEIEDRAALTTFGESPATERSAIARDAYYAEPPEPATLVVSGTRKRRLKGELTITVPLRPIGGGSVYAAYVASPLGMLLGSSMTEQAWGTASDTIAAGIDEYSWTPTVAAAFTASEGRLIKVDIAGRPEYSQVVDHIAGGPTTKVSPAFSAAPSGTSRGLTTWYNHPGIAVGASLAAYLDGDGWRWICSLGRLKSLKIGLNDAKMVVAECVIQFAHCEADHAAAAIVRPLKADGIPCHALGAYTVLSAASGPATVTAAPAAVARTAVDVDSWEVSVGWELVERGSTDSIVGVADLDVVGVTAEATVTLSSPSTTYDADYLGQVQRSLVLGMSTVGAGQGGCVMMPAAVLMADAAQRDLGNGAVRQVLRYQPGPYLGVDASTSLAEASLLIGLSQ